MQELPSAVVLLDSVTRTAPAHAGCIVVTGSHAGRSVVDCARAVPAKLYAFNDAGVGNDGAGIAALAELAPHGVAAVAHTSARIGEARAARESGVIRAVNGPARALGFAAGQRLRETVSGGRR